MSTIVPPPSDAQAQNLADEKYLDTYYYDLMAKLCEISDEMERLTTEKDAISDLLLARTERFWNALGDGSALRGISAQFKDAYGTGYSKKWAESSLPSAQSLTAARIYRNEQNDGDGGWRGVWPVEDGDHMAPPKTPVVYQLLLEGQAVYIGSTVNLASRLAQHGREKEFDEWRAAKCASEAACRDLETALIDRYRPPLNRMIPRPRVQLEDA